MTFSNHCTAQLSNEAKKVINANSWHPAYKAQLLCRVVGLLEAGQWVRTSTGGKSVPFDVCDVAGLVGVTSDRD
jgi:hypothetical protein